MYLSHKPIRAHRKACLQMGVDGDMKEVLTDFLQKVASDRAYGLHFANVATRELLINLL